MLGRLLESPDRAAVAAEQAANEFKNQMLVFISIIESHVQFTGSASLESIHQNQIKYLQHQLSQFSLLKDIPNSSRVAKSLIVSASYLFVPKSAQIFRPSPSIVRLLMFGDIESYSVKQQQQHIQQQQAHMQQQQQQQIVNQGIPVKISNNIHPLLMPRINSNQGGTDLIISFHQPLECFQVNQQTQSEEFSSNNLRASTNCYFLEIPLIDFVSSLQAQVKKMSFITKILINSKNCENRSRKLISNLARQFSEQFVFNRKNLDFRNNLIIVHQGFVQLFDNDGQSTVFQAPSIIDLSDQPEGKFSVADISFPLGCYIINRNTFKDTLHTFELQIAAESSRNKSKLNEMQSSIIDINNMHSMPSHTGVAAAATGRSMSTSNRSKGIRQNLKDHLGISLPFMNIVSQSRQSSPDSRVTSRKSSVSSSRRQSNNLIDLDRIVLDDSLNWLSDRSSKGINVNFQAQMQNKLHSYIRKKFANTPSDFPEKAIGVKQIKPIDLLKNDPRYSELMNKGGNSSFSLQISSRQSPESKQMSQNPISSTGQQGARSKKKRSQSGLNSKLFTQKKDTSIDSDISKANVVTLASYIGDLDSQRNEKNATQIATEQRQNDSRIVELNKESHLQIQLHYGGSNIKSESRNLLGQANKAERNPTGQSSKTLPYFEQQNTSSNAKEEGEDDQFVPLSQKYRMPTPILRIQSSGMRETTEQSPKRQQTTNRQEKPDSAIKLAQDSQDYSTTEYNLLQNLIKLKKSQKDNEEKKFPSKERLLIDKNLDINRIKGVPTQNIQENNDKSQIKDNHLIIRQDAAISEERRAKKRVEQTKNLSILVHPKKPFENFFEVNDKIESVNTFDLTQSYQNRIGSIQSAFKSHRRI